MNLTTKESKDSTIEKKMISIIKFEQFVILLILKFSL